MKNMNANHLKLIAIIAMTIDHIADLLYLGMPNNMISNIILLGKIGAVIHFKGIDLGGNLFEDTIINENTSFFGTDNFTYFLESIILYTNIAK